MKAIDKIVSAFLRQILLRMKELGVNQTELAKCMKVSRPYITKVLHQDVNFSFRTAAKLARALKMDFMLELKPVEDDGLQLDFRSQGLGVRRLKFNGLTTNH